MYTDDDLDIAVTAGVLPASTANAFRNYIAELRQTPAVDEEHFRLLTGFADIFVTIALVLFLSALWSLCGDIAGPAALAAFAWALAEYFTRKRRMALPSIVLLFAFVGGCLRWRLWRQTP